MNFTEHVKIRNEKFGTVIFETLTEKIFITNETGSEILHLIEQGKDLLQIVDELQKNYLENQEIEKDAAHFINCLKENNFIAKK
jgi:Coenzyme PQQ synthesis protein D (PqqD)